MQPTIQNERINPYEARQQNHRNVDPTINRAGISKCHRNVKYFDLWKDWNQIGDLNVSIFISPIGKRNWIEN